jgi:molecular chaperone GrpE
MTGRSKKYENEQEEITNDLETDDQTDENGEENENISENDNNSNDAYADPSSLKITALEKEIFDYRDKLVRKAAEFENYKKRTSEEFVRIISTANEDLIAKILPVIDDMERFEKNYTENTKAEDLKKGMDLIQAKLTAVLKTYGLEKLPSIGTPFDPDLHDALMMVDSDKFGPNTVVDQHECGYKLGDKVIRHAKVIVSK